MVNIVPKVYEKVKKSKMKKKIMKCEKELKDNKQYRLHSNTENELE